MKKETFLTSISIDVYQPNNSEAAWERSKVFYDLLNLNMQQIQRIIKMVRLCAKDGGSLRMI